MIWLVFGVGFASGVLSGALAAGVFVWEHAMDERSRLEAHYPDEMRPGGGGQ